MRYEEIIETPQYVLPTTFDLDDLKINQDLTRRLLKKSNRRVIYSYNDNIHLYEFGNGYALIDISINRLLFYVRYKILKHNFLPKPAVQQVKIWRDQRHPATNDIPKKIFFDFLLPITGIMITDAEQTEDGERFWYNRIHDAWKLNKYVYFVSFIPLRERRRLNNFSELEQAAKEAWGYRNLYMAKRIVITDFPLQEIIENK
jgi:hypothetical protein